LKIHIVDIYTRAREVELPAECPKCGGKIQDGADLVAMQYTYEDQNCTIRKDDGAEYLDDWGAIEPYPEAQMVVGFKCGACETPLVQAEEGELPDGPTVLKVEAVK